MLIRRRDKIWKGSSFPQIFDYLVSKNYIRAFGVRLEYPWFQRYIPVIFSKGLLIKLDELIFDYEILRRLSRRCDSRRKRIFLGERLDSKWPTMVIKVQKKSKTEKSVILKKWEIGRCFWKKSWVEKNWVGVDSKNSRFYQHLI